VCNTVYFGPFPPSYPGAMDRKFHCIQFCRASIPTPTTTLIIGYLTISRKHHKTPVGACNQPRCPPYCSATSMQQRELSEYTAPTRVTYLGCSDFISRLTTIFLRSRNLPCSGSSAISRICDEI
jgi:hypothetical protein